jgi:hypothetical protein
MVRIAWDKFKVRDPAEMPIDLSYLFMIYNIAQVDCLVKATYRYNIFLVMPWLDALGRR